MNLLEEELEILRGRDWYSVTYSSEDYQLSFSKQETILFFNLIDLEKKLLEGHINIAHQVNQLKFDFSHGEWFELLSHSDVTDNDRYQSLIDKLNTIFSTMQIIDYVTEAPSSKIKIK